MTPDPGDEGFRRVWLLSLVVSVGAVAGFFWYVNLTQGHGWVPLGYDPYYYVGYINQVVASGPLQFRVPALCGVPLPDRG